MSSAPLVFQQDSFAGGMNQQVDGSRVGANEYPLLVNGRTRNGTVDPVTRPINRTPNGVTQLQGIYAAGAFSVLFADGKAYYKDETSAGSSYSQIPDFQMSTNAQILYACAVPASTVNLQRSLVSAADAKLGVKFATAEASSPQCLLVQDGINQPWIILPNGTARITSNYNQWTQTNREYVPIGRQMLWSGGILYIVSADGAQIFRSVSGRPLDFMVIIDDTGNKLPSEADGGAAQISHKVDYAPITAISSLNSPDGAFYVSTARTSYAVRPNLDVTLYGEPSYDNVFLFSTGSVNQFSLCDILGDVALVDYSGIRSFNAVQQYRVDGKNSPFSARINKLIDGYSQTASAAVSYDNYALFSVQTVFGRGFLVFDTIAQRWTSLDLHDEFASNAVLMFAEIKTTATRKLLCVTAGNLYELYSSEGESHIAGYYTPEFSSATPGIRQKPVFVKATFVDVLTPGSLFVLPVEDGKRGLMRHVRVSSVAVDNASATPPIVYGSQDKVRVLTVPMLNTSKNCWKCGLYLKWNFSGKLAALQLLSNSETAENAFETQMVGAADSVDIICVSAPPALAATSVVNVFGNGFLLDSIVTIHSVLVNGVTVTNAVVLDDSWLVLTLPVGWSGGSTVSSIVVEVEADDGMRTKFTWNATIAADSLCDNDLAFTLSPSDPAIVDSFGAYHDISTVVSNVKAAFAAYQIQQETNQPQVF